MNAERKLLKRCIEVCKKEKEENLLPPKIKWYQSESGYNHGFRLGLACAYNAVAVALERNMPKRKK